MRKKTAKSNNLEDLKSSLQEAEIIRTCTRIALQNPSLDSETRDEYEIAFMSLNAQIRELKTRMDDVQRRMLSLK